MEEEAMYICYGPSYSWRPTYFLADLLVKYGSLRVKESTKRTLAKIVKYIPSYVVKKVMKKVSKKFEYNFAKYIRGSLNEQQKWNDLFFNTSCKIDIKRFKLENKYLSVPAEIRITKIKGDTENLRSIIIKKAVKSTNYVLDIYTMEENAKGVCITARIVFAEL